MYNKRWSDEEDNRLQELFPNPNLVVLDIAEMLDRTPRSIRQRAFLLGLRRPSSSWTKEEDQRLRDFFPRTKHYKNITDKFPGRTVYGLAERIKTLGLKRRPYGKQEPLQIDPIQAAYLAGVIDCDGSISILSSKCRERQHLRPMVAVFNTDIRLLQEVRHIISCTNLCSRTKKVPEEHHKDVYELKVQNCRDVAKIIRSILSYLIIKREQAELVLEFCENRIPYTIYSDLEWEIGKKVLALNKRGK